MRRLRLEGWLATSVKVASAAIAGFFVAVILGSGASGALLRGAAPQAQAEQSARANVHPRATLKRAIAGKRVGGEYTKAARGRSATRTKIRKSASPPTRTLAAASATPGTNVLYTVDGDFDRGLLVNVNHDEPNQNQLQLNTTSGTFPFIWVALSQRCTIAKISTETGAILGEYRTVSDSTTCSESSRTTVALDGSVWVGHRGPGGVTHVGLAELNGCLDRNGNGSIDTSTSYGDVRPWPGSTSVLADAQDECIIGHVDTNALGLSDSRHMSVDENNKLWVGDYAGGHNFVRINGATGEPETSARSFACGGYGGLIDANGVIWSGNGSNTGLLRWDPNASDSETNPRCVPVPTYGVAIDPGGFVWTTTLGSQVYKISPDGGTILGPFNHGANNAQGLAITSDGDVWVSSSLFCSSECTIGHLKNDGTFVGNVQNPTGAGSTGVSVDASGKVWTANRASNTATRIDPTSGPIGNDDVTPIGEVDLTVNFPAGPEGRPLPYPYNYSDMTGAQLLSSTAAQGTWTVTQDSGSAGTAWGKIVWNTEAQASLPSGAQILVEARAADNEAALGGQAFAPVTNATSFSLTGRFLDVRVTLKPNDESESPVLSDIRICSAGVTCAAPASGETMLIFGPTNSSALEQAVKDAGFVPRVATQSEWGEMTTADFGKYRALLIGDPSCSGTNSFAGAAENASVWGAAVDGSVIVDGTDPVYHGKSRYTNAAVRFAGSSNGRTGAYVSLSCAYGGAEPGTPVPLLDAFKPHGFTVTQVGCYNNAHIVADHPALSDVDDAYMSNWSCSVHEAFDSWPDDFLVLAIARDIGSAYRAPDGTVGTPYILARGEGLRVISNITASTTEGDSAIGTSRTVSAKVVENDVAQPGKTVSFRVVSGPHEGTEGSATTDSTGTAVFSYTGTAKGRDAIEAAYVASSGVTQTSNRLFVTWVDAPPAPPATTTTATPPPALVPTPPRPAPPPDDPGTFNGQVTSGVVLYNGQPIRGVIELKTGDVIDATNGRIEIVTISGRAEFYEGAFKITQPNSANAFTRLELVGGDFSVCGARKTAAAGADDKPVRRLWGKGTGKFETKARYSAATVRGTTWLTEDRCDGSLTFSEQGTVGVYDFSLRRTSVVTTGLQYLAEPPPPPTPGNFVGEVKGQVIVNGVTLEQDAQIRSGDTVDVRNGRITLTTTSGEASFFSGRFVVTQAGDSSAYTVLTLFGGDFSGCTSSKSRNGASRAQDPPKKTVRSLWGKGTGKFQTKSRFSAATVRGTNWLTVDRCDGSLTVVREGIVEVNDFTLNRTVQVPAGKQYLAPAQRP